MSDDYWRNKKKWDQIHHRGEYAPSRPAEETEPPRAVAPEPEQPRVNLLGFAPSYRPPMTGDEKDERIAELERTLYEQWAVFMDCYMLQVQPNDILRKRAVMALDRRLREMGILPSKPEYHKKRKK